jgi:hypothetical protein
MRDATLNVDNVTFCSFSSKCAVRRVFFHTLYKSLSRSFLLVYLCEIGKVNIIRDLSYVSCYVLFCDR